MVLKTMQMRGLISIFLMALSQFSGATALSKTPDFQDSAIEETAYLADVLKIKRYTDELLTLKGKHDTSSLVRMNFLQSRITHVLLINFFQVNAMVGEVSDEIESIEHRIDVAERKRLHEVNLVTISNFATTGTLGIISGSLAMPSRSLPTNPAIINTIGSATSVGLSAAALMLTRSGNMRVPAGPPNVLVYVFDPDSKAPNFPLPIAVRDYLHRKSEQKSDTRAHMLIAHWQSMGLLHGTGAQVVEEACQIGPSKYTTLNNLRSQAAMLRNLRTSLVQTNKGLMKITESVDDEISSLE